MLALADPCFQAVIRLSLWVRRFPRSCLRSLILFLSSLMAVLMIEWFGIQNFSTNNGLVSLAPAVFGAHLSFQFSPIQLTSNAGNAANLALGVIYDSHVPSPQLSSDLTLSTNSLLDSRATTSAVDKVCLLGPACFASAFHLTTLMSLSAVGLAVWLGVRRSRKEGLLLPN